MIVFLFQDKFINSQLIKGVHLLGLVYEEDNGMLHIGMLH